MIDAEEIKRQIRESEEITKDTLRKLDALKYWIVGSAIAVIIVFWGFMILLNTVENHWIEQYHIEQLQNR